MVVKERSEELTTLVVKLKQGNKSCFDRIYELTQHDLYVYALSIAKNESDAEDIMQEVYTDILVKISTLKDPSKFMNWARCILHNNAISRFRSNREVVESNTDEGSIFDTLIDTSEDAAPETRLEHEEISNTIAKIIEDLPVVQRVAVIAKYYDDMSVKEIAEMMDCSEGTVKTRLFYARDKIKEQVELYEEKKGIKINSVIPFIGPAIGKIADVCRMPEANAATVLENAKISAESSANTTTIRKTHHLRLGNKIVGIGLAAAVVVAGLGFSAYQMNTTEKNFSKALDIELPAIIQMVLYTRLNSDELVLDKETINKCENTLLKYISVYNRDKKKCFLLAEPGPDDEGDCTLFLIKDKDVYDEIVAPKTFTINSEKGRKDLSMYYKKTRNEELVYYKTNSTSKVYCSSNTNMVGEYNLSDVISQEEFKKGTENAEYLNQDDFEEYSSINQMGNKFGKNIDVFNEMCVITIGDILSEAMYENRIEGTAKTILTLNGLTISPKQLQEASEKMQMYNGMSYSFKEDKKNVFITCSDDQNNKTRIILEKVDELVRSESKVIVESIS